MKKLYQITALLVFFATLLGAQDFRKYKAKSGHVEYKLSGNSTGTNSIYWDDWGRKEVQIQKAKTTVFGMTNEEDKTVLMLGTDVYTWKKGDSQIQKTENPMARLWKEKHYTEKDIEQFSKESLESLGFKKTGEENVGGKNCEVYEGIAGKLWIWKDNQIAIKTNVKILGINVISEATKIDLNAAVDASLFGLPQNMKVVTVETMNNNEKPANVEDVKKAMKEIFKSTSGNEAGNNTKEKVDDSKKSDENFTEDLINETKDAAVEGAKEGAKETAKETAKDEAKKATKKTIKKLFKSIF